MSSTTISGGSPQIPGPMSLNDPNSTQQANSTSTSTELPPVGTYLSLPFTRATFETLGIAQPQTPDDIAAILAQISDLLEKTMGELRSKRDAGIEELKRTKLGEAAAALGPLEQIDQEIEGLKGVRADKVAERDAKIAERNHLAANNGSASQIAALDLAIIALGFEIVGLDVQIASKTTERFFLQIGLFFISLFLTAFLSGLQIGFSRDDAAVDFAFQTLFDDIAQRLTNGVNLFQGELRDLGPLSQFDQLRLAALLGRIGEAYGYDVDPGALTSLLSSMSVGDSVQPTMLGLVLEAAILGLTPDQLRDADVRGRVIQAAVGLVAGLADVVTLLAALKEIENFEPGEAALSDGSRLRLAI